MEELKKNDFLATLVKNPDITIADLKANDITPSNTSLLSKEEYKNMPAVIDAFKDDEGKFDEKKFNTVYDNARIFYSNYANDELFENVMQNLTYGQDEWFAPQDANYRMDNPVIVLNKRPSNITSGISYLTETIQQDSNLSIREQAQREKVVDFETGETLDYSPNDKAGLFKRFSLPSLVIAQWDEDGTHIEDGIEVSHKAGDLKLNENGRPYYETLGDRDIYNKDLLRASDVLTVDGSKWNKLDFFDSDDTKKSAGKVALNLVAKIAPMFIPWGVGEIYGYLGAANGLTRVMPVLGKTINGLITGDNTNDMGKFLSKWEANAARFDETASDRGRESAITLEGLGNMISAVSGQLFQQRAISTLPVLIQKARGIKDVGNVANLSRNLSLAYMATTSAQQVYGDFKQAGASDRVAGLGMLGSTLALYKLMNIDYFRDNLFKDTFMDESEVRSVLRGASLETKNGLAKALADGGAEVVSEKEAASFVNKIANFYHDSLLKGIQQKGVPGLLARGLSEGTEEVMEEVTTDAIKGITEGLNALGLPVTDEGRNLDFGWSVKDFATRYGTSFVGGFIGGMVFAGQGAYEKWLGKKLNLTPDIELSDMEKLVYYVANGKRGEIDEYLDKWYQKGLLGSKDVSIDGEVMTTLDGISEYIPSTKGISQNEAVYRTLKGALDTIEQEFNSEVDARLFTNDRFTSLLAKGYKEEDIINNPHLITAEALTALGDYSSFQNDLYKNLTKLIQTKIQLKDRIKELSTTTANTEDEKKTQADSIKEDQKVKELQKELKRLREEKDKFFAGEKNKYYSGQAYFAADEGLHRNFVDLSLESYVKLKYGRSLDSFNETELENIKKEYEDYSNKDGRQNIYRAYDLYLDLASRYASVVQERADALEKAYSENKKVLPILGMSGYIASQKAEEQLKKEKEQLDAIAESELTEEQIKRKVDIEGEILKLQSVRNILQTNPQLAAIITEERSTVDTIGSQLDENGKVVIYDDTASRLRDPNTSVSETTLPAQEILKGLRSQYQSDSTSGDFRFDDAELNAFFKGIAASYIKTGGAKTRLSNFFSDAVLRYADTVDDDGAETISDEKAESLGLLRELLGGDLSSYWTDVIRDIDSFVSNLGTDNEAAFASLKEAQDIIKANTRLGESENQEFFNDLMSNLIPSINGESLIDIATEFDSYKQGINYSAFIDIAEKIGTDLKAINLFKLVQQEMQNLGNAGRIDDYIIHNSAISNSLSKEQLDPIFKAVRAIILGAADGTNDIINNFKNSKEDTIPKLATISEKTAKMIIQQGKELEDRITFLRELSEANKARSLRIHKDTALVMRPKWIKGLIGLSEGIKREFDIDAVSLWNETTGTQSFEPTESQFNDWEVKCIAFEQALYDKFEGKFDKSNKGSIKEFADKLLNLVNPKTLYKEASTRISDDKDEPLSGLDLLYYLSTVVSVPTNGFYSAFKQVIADNKTLAPVYGQEFAIKQIVAQALNPALFNDILDGVKENANIKEDVKDEEIQKYLLAKQPLHNLSTILGSAGAGKTVGVVKNILDILVNNSESTNVIFLAREIEQAEKVRDSAGYTQGAYTVDQYCKAVFTEEVNGYSYNKDVPYHWTAGSSINNTGSVFDTNAKLKVLVIDEVETLTGPELQRICMDAEENNILVIGAGDLKQPGTTVSGLNNEGNNTSLSSGIEDCYFIKTPTLTTSMRSQTIAKVENTKKLSDALDAVLSTVQQDPTKTVTERATLVKERLKDEAKLYYYEDPKTGDLAGDMGIETQEDFEKRIQSLSSLDGTVAIITDHPGDYTKYAKDGKVFIVPYEKRAGGEYDYVLVDVDFTKHNSRNGEVNAYLLTQDFYTLTQRSRKGTVIKTSPATSMFKFISDETKRQSIQIDPSELRAFVEWRLKSLDNIPTSATALIDEFNNSPLVRGYEGQPLPIRKETPTKPPIQTPLPEPQEEKAPEGTKPAETEVPTTPEPINNEVPEIVVPQQGQPTNPEVTPEPIIPQSTRSRYAEALNRFTHRDDDNPIENVTELISAIGLAFPKAAKDIKSIYAANRNNLGTIDEFASTENGVKSSIRDAIRSKYSDEGVNVFKLMMSSPRGFYADDNTFMNALSSLKPKEATLKNHGRKRKVKEGDKIGYNDALFSLISSSEFNAWTKETRIGQGSYRDIRTTDLKVKEEAIPDMIRRVGSEIRNGYFDKSFLRQFAGNMLQQRNFEAYGNDTQIWIVPYTTTEDGKFLGLVVSRHIKDTDNYFDIPLMVLTNPSRYGRYIGSIDMVESLEFNRNPSRERHHVPVSDFLAAHPELMVSSQAGVVEVKDPTIIVQEVEGNGRIVRVANKELPGVDNHTTVYLKDNNGKVFLSVTDEPAIARHLFSERSKGVFSTDSDTGLSTLDYGYYALMGIQSKVSFRLLHDSILKIANVNLKDYQTGNSRIKDISEICSLQDLVDNTVTDSKGNRRQLVSYGKAGMILSLACLNSKNASFSVYNKLSPLISKSTKYKYMYTMTLRGNDKTYTIGLVNGYYRVGSFNKATGNFDVDSNVEFNIKASGFNPQLVFETLFGKGIIPSMHFTYNSFNLEKQTSFIRNESVNNELISILKDLTTQDVENIDNVLEANEYRYGIYLDDKAQKESEGNDYYGILDPGTRVYWTDIEDVATYTHWAVNINDNTVIPADTESAPQITFSDFLAQSHLGINANSIDEANDILRSKAADWKYQYIVKTDTGFEVRTYGDENFANWLQTKYGITIDPSFTSSIIKIMDDAFNITSGSCVFSPYSNDTTDVLFIVRQNGAYSFKVTSLDLAEKAADTWNAIVGMDPVLDDYIASKIINNIVFTRESELLDLITNNLELAEKIAIFEDQFDC